MIVWAFDAFELGSDLDFSNIYSIYIKNYNNKIKPPFDPSLTHQTSTQDPTSDKAQGVRNPPTPPLNPRND